MVLAFPISFSCNHVEYPEVVYLIYKHMEALLSDCLLLGRPGRHMNPLGQYHVLSLLSLNVLRCPCRLKITQCYVTLVSVYMVLHALNC